MASSAHEWLKKKKVAMFFSLQGGGRGGGGRGGRQEFSLDQEAFPTLG